MRKMLVLLNPIAGAHSLKFTPQGLADYFKGSDIEVETVYTEYKGHGSEIIRAFLDKGVTDVIAVGGDGSLRDVARECIHQDVRVGVLSTGSGNGIARHLKLPVHSERALDIIKEGLSIPLDAGKLGSHYFFSNAGIGLDAWIIRAYERIPQRGWKAYTRLGVQEYFKYKPSPLEVNIKEERFELSPAICSIALSNQFGYNVKIAPDASLYDGLFDVQLIPMLNIPRSIYFTGHMIVGKYYKAPDVILRQTRDVSVRVEPGLPMQLDGEPYTTEAEMSFEVIPACWNMIVSRPIYEEYKNSPHCTFKD